MVELDKPFFTSELKHFAIVNRIPISSELVREYWSDLSDISLIDFQRACDWLRRTSPFFPKPFEFRKAARKGWM